MLVIFLNFLIMATNIGIIYLFLCNFVRFNIGNGHGNT